MKRSSSSKKKNTAPKRPGPTKAAPPPVPPPEQPPPAGMPPWSPWRLLAWLGATCVALVACLCLAVGFGAGRARPDDLAQLERVADTAAHVISTAGVAAAKAAKGLKRPAGNDQRANTCRPER